MKHIKVKWKCPYLHHCWCFPLNWCCLLSLYVLPETRNETEIVSSVTFIRSMMMSWHGNGFLHCWPFVKGILVISWFPSHRASNAELSVFSLNKLSNKQQNVSMIYDTQVTSLKRKYDRIIYNYANILISIYILLYVVVVVVVIIILYILCPKYLRCSSNYYYHYYHHHHYILYCQIYISFAPNI